MELPYLKLVGGLALIVIAAKLLVPEQEDEDSVDTAAHLWAAIQIVVIADIVMSLDNVIAVAAAANGSVPLLILGLAISIPLIVAGAALIMALLNKLPILVWAGAALLGWIAGDVIATDPAIHPRLDALFAGSARRRARPHAGLAWHGAAFCQSRQRRRDASRCARRHRRAGSGSDLAQARACKSTPRSPPRRREQELIACARA